MKREKAWANESRLSTLFFTVFFTDLFTLLFTALFTPLSDPPETPGSLVRMFPLATSIESPHRDEATPT